MKFIHKLTCMVKGHRPLDSITVEPTPPPKIGGYNIHTINNLGITAAQQVSPGHISISNGFAPAYNPLKAMEDYHFTQQNNGATLQITAQGLSSKLCVCARCHGVYWRTEPFLPTLASAHSVPELAEYTAWKQRELYEAKEREGNEAAAKLYKQYKMVLKLAGPSCDDPEQGK